MTLTSFIGFVKGQKNGNALDQEAKSIWLGIIFLLPQYQGLGYASQAVRLAESLYTDFHRWTLETIFQEKQLVAFYRHLGYKMVRLENEQADMDLVFMEKIT